MIIVQHLLAVYQSCLLTSPRQAACRRPAEGHTFLLASVPPEGFDVTSKLLS